MYNVLLLANNSISNANDSVTVSVLWRVGKLEWVDRPALVDVNIPSNFSFRLVSGSNVTITVCYGDNSPCNESFVSEAKNSIFSVSHA